MLILFIILTMVFSSYVIKTSTAEFEKQIDVQLRGITTQIDNTLRLADDIALQIAANYQIIDAFSGLQEYHDEKNYFVENTDVDYTIKQHLISYMLKQNILKRISLFNSNQDITYVGKAVDFGYLKKIVRTLIFLQIHNLISQIKKEKAVYSESILLILTCEKYHQQFPYCVKLKTIS